MKKVITGLLIIIVASFMFIGSKDYLSFLLNHVEIDNTNHGWEVKRNSSHMQPDIPDNAKKILTKYKGIYIGDPEKKIIYLTIDLGYESGNTKAVLDILRDNNVKATFFIVLSYLKNNSEIVDRIINEGHSIQNHTANYRHLNTLSEYQIKREIMDMHDVVKKRYDISMKYLRLPYEDWSEKVMKTVSETGYNTVFWSIAGVDWVEGRDASYIYNSIINNYHNGAVVLMHAVSKSSPHAIDVIIKELKGKGFEFRILDM